MASTVKLLPPSERGVGTARGTDATGALRLEREHEFIPGTAPPGCFGKIKFCLKRGFMQGTARRDCLLQCSGVKMGKNGKSVFNYNPQKVTRFVNFLGLLVVLPAIFDRWWYVQLVTLIGWAWLYMRRISDSALCAYAGETKIGRLDDLVGTTRDDLRGLANFVLGLYISLSLAQTYYKNRSMFGTVFGSTLGLCQQITAWVQPPADRAGVAGFQGKARGLQELLVRWANAAYRLLVLEVRGNSAEEIQGVLVTERKLLTEAEFASIKDLPSRATHIYQWMNNVLLDAMRAGYIQDTKLLTGMQYEVNKMRGANVWGLPSLPLPYTLFVTILVKVYLFSVSCNAGAEMNIYWPTDTATCDYTGSHSKLWCWLSDYLPIVSLMWEIFISNFLYQGALDLHGWLYSPNGGQFLGHMPADNFLDFVQKVCFDMLNESGSLSGRVPYKLTLG